MIRKREQKIPKFITILLKILEDPKSKGIMEWSQDGKTILLFDQKKFTQVILPHYFSHSNFISMVRQLNIYDFHKLPRQDSVICYQNIFFDRECPQLFTKICRKNTKQVTLQQSDTKQVISKKILGLKEKLQNIANENEKLSNTMQNLKIKQHNLKQQIQGLQAVLSKHKQEQQFVDDVLNFDKKVLQKQSKKDQDQKQYCLLQGQKHDCQNLINLNEHETNKNSD